MSVKVFDNRICTLGEGPLWHPQRQQLFWFDIASARLYSQWESQKTWQFDEMVSAAGWVDQTRLLIAGESSLFLFDLESATIEPVCALEADNPITRSNDGRADPWGGFWIGTMGKQAESKAGAIYRYYRGELRQLFNDITIANTICFDHQKRWAYFADTDTAKIWRQALHEKNGWPVGEAELFLDCKLLQLKPDGAVCDQQGRLWVACWGSAQLVCFNKKAEKHYTLNLPVTQPTCPAFGGDHSDQLYITSATQGLSRQQRDQQPLAGQTFVVQAPAVGRAEYQVIME